ncbi:MAG: hypothetical protein PHC28_01785 [Flavobacterium sp.]|uniref:hypothetical protein n=1 Tax=Flavobacterium sp. TaxID=239 RepID=UPI00262319AF|nr:hypothetical protein [Flavobacterium sp.]MDD5149198.1 hypothetical protein [Flavobacterium sp.]
MKTQLLILILLTSVFATQINAQDRTTINAKNSEISDNLDLRAVASIFGDSKNLQDFERRLNDPTLQISNLDLNNDDEVDYLRVIESVENRTHVIIIQSVLDRDLYQDVATIEVEKDNYNNVHVQVVGDVYMYGHNYIYEPVYYSTPLIYASFWVSNYRPYYSTWDWNYYPSYYYSWNPFPVFRYRYNMNHCLNSYNQYNYVNYRRSSIAVTIYNSRRTNGYERQHPDYSFSRRNSEVNNRYELDKRRNTRNVGYSQNRTESPRVNAPQRTENQRVYSQNRTESPRVNAPQRTENQRDYSQNRTESPRVNAPQRTENQRDYSQNRIESPRVNAPQRTENQRDYSQNRTESPRVNAPQRTENQRDYSQNRTESPRVNTPQRTENQRDYSQNRTESPRVNTPQRTESRSDNSQSRNTNSGSNSTSSSRNSNRRL